MYLSCIWLLVHSFPYSTFGLSNVNTVRRRHKGGGGVLHVALGRGWSDGGESCWDVMEEGGRSMSEQWRDVALWHVGIFCLVYVSSSLLAVLES